MNELTAMDVKNIKSIFGTTERKIIVNIQTQKAIVVNKKNNEIIGFVEKESYSWKYHLTTPLIVRFKYLGKNPVCVLYGLFSKIEMTFNLPSDTDLSEVINKRFQIMEKTVVMMNDKRNGYILPSVVKSGLEVPRKIFESVANFQKIVDYSFVPC